MVDRQREEPLPVPQDTHVIPEPETAEQIFRLLTPVLKGLTAKAAIAGLAECMECMGGKAPSAIAT